ncbi:hypothetical protein L0337_14620 [candidate division KSB1 bacterium]|nr:hypothetical protein [candidate division KSB1 bacterium]
MADIPLTPELTKFLINVFRATKRGLIPWEPTADPGTLIAPLEGEYSLRLEEVYEVGDQASEPYHVLSLYKERQPLLRVDRRDVTHDEIAEAFGPEFKKPHQLFRELWKHAYHMAHHIGEELNTINRLLDRKLMEKSKSFSKAE